MNMALFYCSLLIIAITAIQIQETFSAKENSSDSGMNNIRFFYHKISFDKAYCTDPNKIFLEKLSRHKPLY